MKRKVLGAILAATLAAGTLGADAVYADSSVELSVILCTGWEPFQESIEKYMEENPDVSVDVQVMPTEEYKTMIKAKFAGDDAPDILPIFSGEDFISYYQNGYIADLSGMEDTVSRMIDGADATLRTEDGALYGLPVEEQMILGYYNKEMFEKYGLSVPATWDELLNACEVLKENGITPIALGHKDEWVGQMLTYGLNATKVQVADPEFYAGIASGESKFAENAGFLDTLTKYQDLINKGFINEGSLSMTADQQYEMFIKEEAGMTFTGSWGNDAILALEPTFTLGGFEIPGDEGETFGASVSINGGLGLNANSENIEEAQKLLAYMVGPETLAEYLKGKGPSPYSDVEVELSAAMKEAADMEEGQMLCQFDNVYWASGVQEVFLKGVQDLVAGTTTPEEILQAMDAATEKANR